MTDDERFARLMSTVQGLPKYDVLWSSSTGRPHLLDLDAARRHITRFQPDTIEGIRWFLTKMMAVHKGRWVMWGTRHSDPPWHVFDHSTLSALEVRVWKSGVCDLHLASSEPHGYCSVSNVPVEIVRTILTEFDVPTEWWQHHLQGE